MADFLRREGDPRRLLVYQVASRVTLVTEHFVHHHLSSKSRTVDQMQQAARSCKQNIVEGCEAGFTSKETEIKLTNVARASLAELLEDYIDALMFVGLKPWGKDHPRTLRVRAYVKSPGFDEQLPTLLPRLNKEELCNLAITLSRRSIFSTVCSRPSNGDSSKREASASR